MKNIAIIYFSMTGETWADGKIINVNKGFTQRAAEYIQQATNGDLYQIKQTRQYNSDHFKMINEAKEEFQSNARPALNGDFPNLDTYDIIFLGFPNWWGTLPMPVLTFTDHYNWKGKRIIPFVTSGGSGFGNALKDLSNSTKWADIDTHGLQIKGTQVDSSKELIQKWAQERI